ncbi:MAG: hypothetical protein KGN84_14680 [Acidobacteriota bacterium]|nr:hypothetical protein [Acidobacteriota bacterium]
MPLAGGPEVRAANKPASGPEPIDPDGLGQPREVSRQGMERIYRFRVAEESIAARVDRQLAEMGKSLRLPGFRPGKIPMEILRGRYGARARESVAEKFAIDAARQLQVAGNLTSRTEAANDPATGDLSITLNATHLPDLPDPDFEAMALKRLTSPNPAMQKRLDEAFRTQILDGLDAAYEFTLAPVLVTQELGVMAGAISAEFKAIPEAEREGIYRELRTIAERRVRLGAVVVEMARRFGLSVGDAEIGAAKLPGESLAAARGRLTEDRVIAWLSSRAKVTERPATADEIAAIAE